MKTITYNPETHLLVPREPTDKMLRVANEKVLGSGLWREGYKAMLAAAPQPEQVDVGSVIDLKHVTYDRLVEAACNSKWIPKEYCANDWINDCIDFLINGNYQPDRTAELTEALAEVSAYQSDIDTVTQHNVELQLETIALKSALNAARYALERLSPSLNNQHPNVIFVFEALAKINEVLK